MAWAIESTRDIATTPATIWRYYTDPATWPRWAHNTAAARFEGQIEVGSEGRVEPKRGRQTIAVRVTVLEPEERLVSEARVPGAVVRFGCRIEPTPTGVRIRHEVGMSGPMAGVYGLMVKRWNARELPEEMERLADLVSGTRA